VAGSSEKSNAHPLIGHGMQYLFFLYKEIFFVKKKTIAELMGKKCGRPSVQDLKPLQKMSCVMSMANLCMFPI
jgi:hypothetical protein